jgi:hypothetical protein
MAAAAMIGLLAHAAAAPAAALEAGAGPVLYIDDGFEPQFSIEWETAGGVTVKLEGQAPYTAPEQRIVIGRNIEGFVAVGGTRLTKSAGHPSGAILRVGFYKKDTDKLFFEDIREGSSVTVTMSGVRFIRDGAPDPATTMQHLKYTLADIKECGLSEEAMDQYNTYSPTDTMRGKITPENARLGSLDGVIEERPAEEAVEPAEHAAGMEGAEKAEGDKAAAQRDLLPEGRADVWLEEDGSVSMRATIPYALFRHVRDPWMRTDPGGFFEPYHFHIEFEAIPVEVWEEEYEDRPLPRRGAGGDGAGT